MRLPDSRLLVACLLFAALAVAMPAARSAGPVDCKLRFNMSGWSAFYKTLSGSGTVTCDNGQRMNVSISSKGGGLTFGKSRIDSAGNNQELNAYAKEMFNQHFTPKPEEERKVTYYDSRYDRRHDDRWHDDD